MAPTSPLAGEDVAQRQERGSIIYYTQNTPLCRRRGDISPARGEIKKQRYLLNLYGPHPCYSKEK